MDIQGVLDVTHNVICALGGNMYRRYKSFLLLLMFFASVAVLTLCTRAFMIYAERKNCLCSTLTEEEAKYPIDNRLTSIIDIETLVPGTFARISTHCKHDVYMHLTVFVDEGWYCGYTIQ